MSGAKPIRFLRPKGGGVCTPAEHANTEDTFVATNYFSDARPYGDIFANGATVQSKSITTTKTCCIVVVVTFITYFDTQVTQIQRGGVDKTVETTVSAPNFAIDSDYGHLQYATEVLGTGTYQYDLKNTSGGNIAVYGSTMKIVAVSAS